MDTTLVIILIIGILVGAIAAWLIAKSQIPSQGLSDNELKEKYILKEVFQKFQDDFDVLKDDNLYKEQEIKRLNIEIATERQIKLNLDEKLSIQKNEVNELQQRFQKEFENLANRLLEEKSQKFAQQNQVNLTQILDPLKEKIRSFEESVEKKYLDESKERFNLKKEIEQLRLMNQQLSSDAQNLVSALKGDNKAQGNWGEMQLEMLLEKAGLAKDIHFSTQTVLFDEEGNKKLPDFIINLPEQKHLVIDSKVSLVAYERFFNGASIEEQKLHLKSHVDSLRAHVKNLSGKNYQQLYQINSPDYLLLYVPIEPAFTVAMQEDNSLFTDALEKNIVIVTNSTLLATMRTVSFLWKQEKQKQNVIEIARQSGALYDKFCDFVEDLRRVGLRLDNARDAYDEAMHKLSDGKRYGDTLIGKAEKIKELGARTSKILPKELTNNSEQITANN
jgi:DNA recombination protein RmuC